jgi:hypothetical protein
MARFVEACSPLHVPPLRTGLNAADAQDDFMRARRRAAAARMARFLSRERGDIDVILPYAEVVEALGFVSSGDVGLRVIPLDSIVGTVDRTSGFDRSFRPTTSRVRPRWERIAAAMRRGEPMPPISVYRIGDAHFVRDGHHRVSVARALGLGDIEAFVTEVRTRVGADRTLRMSDLPVKSSERLFFERVPLSREARARVHLTDGERYAAFAEGVEAWGFRLMQDRAEHIDRAHVARVWFEREYAPVVEMLREAGMLGSGTEADGYMRVSEERYRLLRTHDWSEDVLARLREAGVES